MREIGGAVGVAAVSAVLVSRAGVNAFHAAFRMIFVVVAALGALTAAIGFPRRATQEIELEPAPSHVSIVVKTGPGMRDDGNYRQFDHGQPG
jgi:hypothetical protein